MYAPLLLFSTLALDALAAALPANRPSTWVRFTSFSLLALYTHYLAALLLLVAATLACLRAARTGRRGSCSWL